MPWNSGFAKHLIAAEEQKLITPSEYDRIRFMMLPPEQRDQPPDWDRPLEPGPVKIVPQSAERQRAQADADMTGLGVLVDLKRIEPSRVILLRPQVAVTVDAEAIARLIVGPREAVPDTSRYTLRELQDILWEAASLQERNYALWIANAILRLIELETLT